MSKVSDFYAKVMADETLKSQIVSILAGVSIENAEDEQLEKIGGLAKGLGFDISVEEAKEYNVIPVGAFYNLEENSQKLPSKQTFFTQSVDTGFSLVYYITCVQHWGYSSVG